MKDYITLLGAEQVQSAASSMNGAADRMQRAADTMRDAADRTQLAADLIAAALDRHQGFLRAWLEDLEVTKSGTL